MYDAFVVDMVNVFVARSSSETPITESKEEYLIISPRDLKIERKIKL